MMWACWTLLGMWHIVSARYMTKAYKCNMKLHVLTGWLSVIFTILSGAIAFAHCGFKIRNNMHSWVGFIMWVQAPLIAFFGAFTEILRYSKKEWAHKKIMTLTAIHKYHGFVMTFGTQIAITLGIGHYLITVDQH
jgi:hypothetical protein